SADIDAGADALQLGGALTRLPLAARFSRQETAARRRAPPDGSARDSGADRQRANPRCQHEMSLKPKLPFHPGPLSASRSAMFRALSDIILKSPRRICRAGHEM